jgi:phage terminase large subunit
MVKGGRGSKKSTTESLWIIFNMMKYKDSNTLVVRKVFKDHKDSTYAQLNWAINRLEVSHLWYAKLSPLEIIYIPTGQKILFRGLDDPMSITSMTVEHGYLCWVWFEEFYQINNENDFNMVDMSIRGNLPEPLFKQVTGTFNPWNEKHWIKGRFFDNPDSNTYATTTTYGVNEFLGADDIRLFEEMKTRNPRRYNVEGHGNWGIAEGLVYDNWEEHGFDINQLLKENPRLETANGLDFGYTADPTASINIAIDTMYKEIWIYDEHYQKGMLNSDIASMLRYKGLSKSEIIADSAEPKSIDEIKLLGIERIKSARKGKDSVLNGIQFLQQFKIYVHPKCVSTILEFNNYAWDTKDGKQLNKPTDDFNHLMDALRYSVEKFIGGKKELKAVSSLY